MEKNGRLLIKNWFLHLTQQLCYQFDSYIDPVINWHSNYGNSLALTLIQWSDVSSQRR